MRELDSKTPVVEAKDIEKTYGHVDALRGACFAVYPAEVVALVGDNGAGKSTLVKILTGVEQPDDGSVYINGSEVELSSPITAREHGIEVVYQDLALASHLDTPSNLFLGREILRSGLLGKLRLMDKAAMRRDTMETLNRFGLPLISLGLPVSSLSGGQRQSVAVVRALAYAKTVVFMDEPTAALGVRQRARVLDLIRRVRDEGMSVVLVSHNMPEVLQVADRVEVLRLGARVARMNAAEVGVADLVGAMTGALDDTAMKGD